MNIFSRHPLVKSIGWLLALAVLGLIPFFNAVRATGSPAVNRSASMSSLPPVVLWAWERAEDLRFVKPDEVAIALLSAELLLTSNDVVVKPRRQPLRVPAGADTIAVVRIDTDRKEPPKLSEAQRAKAVEAILSVANSGEWTALQIDFDATASQRAFYRALLSDLRQALPKSLPLSMTALASWCLGDRWLAGLPVDEAVPMLFRMGPERLQVVAHFAQGRDFREPACRNSVGISTDEPVVRLPPGRRIYVFHTRPWDREAVARVLAEVRRWQ